MKSKNFFKFVLSPRKYFKKRVEEEVKKIMNREGLLQIDDFKETDVFLVAFPKSGITWLQNIIAGLQYGIDTQYLPDKLTQEIIPDIYDKKFYKRFGDLKIFKSHELPKPEYKKVIYLVRDGRDAMVSYYHFNKNLDIQVSLEEMIMHNKFVYPAPWWIHIRQWLQNPYKSQIIYLKYENLLLNPEDEVKKILNFLGWEREERLITKVIQGTNFEKMKEKARKYDGLGHKYWNGEKGVKFFRKGKAGTYKEELSKELIEFFNSKAINELKAFDYEI